MLPNEGLDAALLVVPHVYFCDTSIRKFTEGARGGHAAHGGPRGCPSGCHAYLLL